MMAKQEQGMAVTVGVMGETKRAATFMALL